MADFATFTGPGGSDPSVTIHGEIEALSTITAGDMLLAGQIFRTKIRQRTAAGVDVDGAPFAPYSERSPYYFYPNKEAAGSNREARATAARNRHAKTGRIGKRTPLGIKYESYAAMKAAMGRTNVDLYSGLQHPHMLDAILLRVAGFEIDQSGGAMLTGGGALDAFENNQPNTQLTMGFYGPEAQRARGQDKGNSKTPRRHFFGLNQEDLDIAARAVGERMQIRASGFAGGGGAAGSMSGPSGASTITDDPSTWLGF
jgi:hypothetical protein